MEFLPLPPQMVLSLPAVFLSTLQHQSYSYKTELSPVLTTESEFPQGVMLLREEKYTGAANLYNQLPRVVNEGELFHTAIQKINGVIVIHTCRIYSQKAINL